MSPLQLFIALSGLAVIVIYGECPESDFANPPPLPTKGTSIPVLSLGRCGPKSPFAGFHSQHYAYAIQSLYDVTLISSFHFSNLLSTFK